MDFHFLKRNSGELGGNISLKSETERKYYLDNLRWASILLLIPFHTAMAWNCWGEGNYIWFHNSRVLSSFIVLVSPWYMALLFVLAGISARSALKKRTFKDFALERISKLSLPMITGMISVVALMAYFADSFNYGYQGNFFSHYNVYLTKFTDLTGYDGGWTPGHLWFLLYLFIISMICLGLIILQKKYFPKLNFENMNTGWIVLLGVLLPPASLVLNIGGKSIGFYMVLYLIGYYIFSEDKILDRIVKYRHIFLTIMLISDATDVYMFIWADHAYEIVNSIAMYFTCWFGILTLLGFGKTEFNRNNKITRYLTSRSFLIYIFHFMWVVIFQFYLSKITGNTIALVTITVTGSIIMSLITSEIIRRIPLVNFLFGIKKVNIR
jgi:glucan biosynthesis protein C